jgi:1,4-alpha-glucan branching enzyme
MTAPSPHPGMGALLRQGGCSFRVWAPNAEAVAVTGSSPPLQPFVSLARDGEFGAGAAYWSAFVPGVRADDEYRFLLTRGGKTISKLDPQCRDATSSVGNSIVCDLGFDWGSEGWRMPSWNELVVYEMHIGTFNALVGGGVGTFESIVAKLDHLQDLGINAIEIMPAVEFDNDQSVGYNPALPFAIESAYGRPKVVQELVRQAHRRGIAIIVDVVYNHFSPGDQCLWQFDGWSENGRGGIYFYNDDRRHTPWGDRPDFGRPEVRQYIRDNALMWLLEYRVDGLRWDSTGCCRMNRGFCAGECCGESLGDGWNLMRYVNDEIGRQQPWKIAIAEDLHDEEAITADTWIGGAGFDAQWNPSFLHPIRASVIAEFDPARDMWSVRDAITRRYHGNAFERVIFVESHNEASAGRLTERIWRGDAANWYARKRSTLAAGILLTSPGIPMLFQGQEFLEWGDWSDVTPMDWHKRERFAGIYLLHRELIRLRRNWHNNTRGLRGQHVNVFHVNDSDKLIGYHRWADGGPGDDVVVVANFANQRYDRYHLGFPRGGLWYCRFNGDAAVYSGDFGNFGGYDTNVAWEPDDNLPASGDVSIGPYTILIFSQ